MYIHSGTTERDMSGYGVIACRGHWHVTANGEHLVIPGDPFATEEDAHAAILSMSESAAASFFATEALSEMHCPTCGAHVNATDALIGVTMSAWARPEAVTMLSELAELLDNEYGLPDQPRYAEKLRALAALLAGDAA